MLHGNLVGHQPYQHLGLPNLHVSSQGKDGGWGWGQTKSYKVLKAVRGGKGHKYTEILWVKVSIVGGHLIMIVGLITYNFVMIVDGLQGLVDNFGTELA